MALPTSRDYDAVDAGPLAHTTVNNIQDGIVNLEADRVADILHEFAIGPHLMDGGVAPTVLGPTVSFRAVDGTNQVLPLNLKIGEVFKSWKMVIRHDQNSTELLRVTVIRWGGSQFPVTLAVGTFENVPGQVATVSNGVVSESLLTGDLSVFPLTGNEEYAYGLHMIMDQDGGGDTVRVENISYITAFL